MGVVDSKILEVEPVSHPVPNPLVIDHMAHLKHVRSTIFVVWIMMMMTTMMMVISLGSHDRLGSIPAKPGGYRTQFVCAELSECSGLKYLWNGAIYRIIVDRHPNH